MIKDVCEMTGLGRTVVGRIYRNEVTNVNFETLNSLCLGLGIGLIDLLTLVPDDQLSEEDVQHIQEREANVKAYTEMRKRNARKKEED